MSTSRVLIGAKRQRRFENEIQQIVDELQRKRRKLSLSNIDDVSRNSSSKCPPLTPVPSQQAENGQQVVTPCTDKFRVIGTYRLFTSQVDNPQIFTAIDTRQNGRLLICRRLDRSKYAHMMQLSYRLRSDLKAVNADEDEENQLAYDQIFPSNSEIIRADDGDYYYFEPQHYGSLHTHVVENKRLDERRCLHYFRQILHLLIYCHRRGVVLRDLKLRKFVFADPERKSIRLDGVSELYICPEKEDVDNDNPDDLISDRHGCPAYVGPEILDLKQKSYSGRAADIWSLGVLLYVALYGRYPFYDTTPARLFAKIRHANIHLGDDGGISFDARSLIRCLLRRDPDERPSAMDILAHPWLQSKDESKNPSNHTRRVILAGSVLVSSSTGIRYVIGDRNVERDQCVPCGDGKNE